jgi:GT2 family glycosyltransferase
MSEASKLEQIWLIILIRLDVLRSTPREYLTAVMWRLLGKKLRARNRIAPLAGRSRHAYRVWILRREPSIWAAAPAATADRRENIIPVIDCRASAEGADVTVRSIRSSHPASRIVLIGGGPHPALDETGNLLRIAGPEELGERVGECWICPLQPGDLLSARALPAYAGAAAATTGRLIYADDDLVDDRGVRRSPHFKPDWNSELFRHHDFVTHSSIIKPDPMMLAHASGQGWVRELTEAAIAACDRPPEHLPLVLHHRRSRPAPTPPARVEECRNLELPSLTAIVLTRNRIELLHKCIEGLRAARYPRPFETIVVDNDSDEPAARAYLGDLVGEGIQVLHRPGKFNFSALNNGAVAGASGQLLCFLNNDVEMLDPDWLILLARQAARPEVGAVGARLLYPDGTIQHAGVVTGVGGGAAHAGRFLAAGSEGYFRRHQLPQYVSAVTAACMVVARDKFIAVGGFDEDSFPVAFNDVDLCLKLNRRGWQSFYEPRATLIHHESKSRGSDASRANRGRFAGELALLKRRWNTATVRDPYHSAHLSPFSDQFVIDL